MLPPTAKISVCPAHGAAGEAGVRAGRRAFRLSFAGLLTTMALASLDQNILSSALPRIAGDLGGLAHLPWVITARDEPPRPGL
jgi:hypothetical protein